MATAQAAPFGSPSRSTDGAAVAVQVVAGTERRTLATGCDGDRCATWGTLDQAGLRIDLRAHDAVGLWASGAYAQHTLTGTGHNGQGGQVSGGVSVQWPREGVRPAAQLAAQGYRTRTLQSSGSIRSTSEGRSVRAAGMAVVGSSQGGATGWAGPSVTAYEQGALDVRTDDLQVSLTAKNPVGLALGGELTSDALGPAWRRSSHLTLGAEAQLIDVWGLGVWFGVTY